MSVSEGIKRYFDKNYFLKLIGEDKEEHKIKIQPWTKAYELKIKISQKYFINYKFVRLFYQNIEMIDHNTMLDYKIIDSKSKIKNIYLKIFIFNYKKP
jgi:hypothetical protein